MKIEDMEKDRAERQLMRISLKNSYQRNYNFTRSSLFWESICLLIIVILPIFAPSEVFTNNGYLCLIVYIMLGVLNIGGIIYAINEFRKDKKKLDTINEEIDKENKEILGL